MAFPHTMGQWENHQTPQYFALYIDEGVKSVYKVEIRIWTIQKIQTDFSPNGSRILSHTLVLFFQFNDSNCDNMVFFKLVQTSPSMICFCIYILGI